MRAAEARSEQRDEKAVGSAVSALSKYTASEAAPRSDCMRGEAARVSTGITAEVIQLKLHEMLSPGPAAELKVVKSILDA